MAIINVTILKGRSRETKNRIIEGLTDVMVDATDAKPHQVRVVINEVEGGNYAVGGKPLHPDDGD